MKNNQTDIVICAAAKCENLYINDWVKYHLALGFDHIYLFDNNDSTMPFIGNFIEDIDKVTIFNVNNIHKKDFQDECYTTFYTNYKQTFAWCAFIDIDEFIVLKDVKTIHEYLSLPKFNNFEVIKLCWHAYGDDEVIKRDISIPVTKFFKVWLKDNLLLNSFVKSIVKGNLEDTFFASSHTPSNSARPLRQCLCDGKPTEYTKHIDPDGDRPNEDAWINHYVTKTLDEFLNQKFGRTDMQFIDKRLGLDYYWKINKPSEEKEIYINEFLRKYEKSRKRDYFSRWFRK